MHVRMIPKSTPEMKFAEVANPSAEEYTGKCHWNHRRFWTIRNFPGVSVVGYHLHFISDDHTLVAMSWILSSQKEL